MAYADPLLHDTSTCVPLATCRQGDGCEADVEECGDCDRPRDRREGHLPQGQGAHCKLPQSLCRRPHLHLPHTRPLYTAPFAPPDHVPLSHTPAIAIASITPSKPWPSVTRRCHVCVRGFLPISWTWPLLPLPLHPSHCNCTHTATPPLSRRAPTAGLVQVKPTATGSTMATEHVKATQKHEQRTQFTKMGDENFTSVADAVGTTHVKVSKHTPPRHLQFSAAVAAAMLISTRLRGTRSALFDSAPSSQCFVMLTCHSFCVVATPRTQTSFSFLVITL
jgi:hypothetical protein